MIAIDDLHKSYRTADGKAQRGAERAVAAGA